MDKLTIFIVLTLAIVAIANCRNIDTFTYEGITDKSGFKMDLSPFVEVGGKYYFLEGKEKLNWFEAAQYCQSIGGELSVVESDADLDELSKHLLNLGFNDLGKEGHFFSTTNGNRIPLYNWSSGQSANALNKELCVQWTLHLGKFILTARFCIAMENYICKQKPKTFNN